MIGPSATMGTEVEDPSSSPNFSTWNLASGFEPGTSSSDEDDDYPGTYSGRRVNVFTGYDRRPGYSARAPAPADRFRRPYAGNNRWSDKPMPTGRDVYWSSTGPKTETRKLLGYTLDLPVIAPMSAPPEDKKLILTQTVDRISEAGIGDWPAKTTLLSQRFALAVPNATNEAWLNSKTGRAMCSRIPLPSV